MKNSPSVTLLIVVILVAGLMMFGWWTLPDLRGTDDLAMELIGQTAPAYRPWVESCFEPSDLQEQWLFVLQAVAGGLLLVASLIRLIGSVGRKDGEGNGPA